MWEKLLLDVPGLASFCAATDGEATADEAEMWIKLHWIDTLRRLADERFDQWFQSLGRASS